MGSANRRVGNVTCSDATAAAAAASSVATVAVILWRLLGRVCGIRVARVCRSYRICVICCICPRQGGFNFNFLQHSVHMMKFSRSAAAVSKALHALVAQTTRLADTTDAVEDADADVDARSAPPTACTPR